MTARIGVHETKITRMNSALASVIGAGTHVTDARVFATASESPPNGAWARCKQLSDQGYIVHMSFKLSNSWSQIGAGSDDARATSIAAFLNTCATPGFIGFHHEAQGDGVASEYRAAFARLRDRIKLTCPTWKSELIYVGGTFWFGNAGGPNGWWADGTEFLGCDTYNRRGASDGGSEWASPSGTSSTFGAADEPLTLLTVPRQSGREAPYPFAVSKGAKLTLPELGCAIDNPALNPSGYVAKRAAWLAGVKDLCKDLPNMDSVVYYDIDRNDTAGRPDWAISGGKYPMEPASITAFYGWTQGATPPPPPPPPATDFVPGVVPPMTRVKLSS